MAATDQDESGKVLPSSRQPVPGSEPGKAAESDGKDGDKGNRSAADIEAELDAVTERLAANVDALVDRLQPKQLAGRSVGRVGRLVVTADGRPRPEIVGAVIGGLLGVAVLTWWSRTHR